LLLDSDYQPMKSKEKNLIQEVSHKVITQDNAITSARYEMSALEKNIVYLLMGQLKQTDQSDTLYFISVKELMELTHTKNSYDDLKRATESLVGRVLSIPRPNGNLLQASLISSAEYIYGQGIIEISMDPKIRPYFFDLKKNFTTFQLHMALSLNSKYAKRIYEMLSQYKDLGYLKLNLLEIKKRLHLYDEKKGEEQYQNWNDFVRRILNVAKTEINEKTDLKIDFNGLKKGRKYVEVEFTIALKEGKQLPLTIDDTTTVLFSRLVNDFRLRRDQAAVVLERHSVPEINKALYDISVKAADGSVANIGAYTAKVFNLN
jgi:plasmid replication initiation protein